MRRYLDPEFGDLPVPELTPAVVRRWWAGLSKDHPTVNARAYALLRAILSTAVTDETRQQPVPRARRLQPSDQERRPTCHSG